MKLRRVISIMMALVILATMAAVPAMAAADKTLTTTGSVYLRKGPATSYSAITSVVAGKSFTYKGASVYSSSGTLWHKISYNNKDAWVSAKYSYVTINGVKMDNSVFVTTTASVNLRNGAGAGNKVITSVPAGRKLFYLGKQKQDSNGRIWYKVSCDKGIAWVTSKYSRLSTDPVIARKVIATASVNIRKGPGANYAKHGAVSAGTIMNYLNETRKDSKGTNWYKVQYKEFIGWVSSKYAKLQ